MNQPRFSLIVVLAATLCSCQVTPQQLLERGGSRLLEVEAPPSVVYRKVVEGVRACFSRYEVSADYFPDNQTGRVTAAIKTNLNFLSLFTIGLEPSGAGTRLQVAEVGGVSTIASAAERWAKGEYENCPYPR